MSGTHIECIELSKQYKGKLGVVDAVVDIDLKIEKNSVVILKGRSGAGKSTLLSLMCGLVRPTKGRVMLDNLCISEMADRPLSSLLTDKIGIIFQGFNLLPTYSVYENIEIALVPKGMSGSDDRDNIFALLEQFNLKEKALMLPSELSAGQQQKVAIIRSLVKKPSVIFADEPTGSVDEETAGEILEHLMIMKRENHATLIIATHGTIPEQIADRVIFMENGRIKE